jgi:tetratricopeptide (TPR) repeat protein
MVVAAAALAMASLALAPAGCGLEGTDVKPRVVTLATSATTPDPAKTQAQANPASARPDPFVGSASCKTCHAEFHKLWATSWHGLAMQTVTPEMLASTQLAPQDEPVQIGDKLYQAAVADGKGWVEERAADGATKRYPIEHSMGGKNVYYFLTTLERGRLQVLPLAYDVHKKLWYDTAASGVRHFPDRQGQDEALPWTDRMFTFNTTCFNCHVSQLATNYDLGSDAYNTTWGEAGISCEACHGPAREHVETMLAGETGTSSEAIKIIRTVDFNASQMNDMCATCHAKLAPLSMNFLPGDAFADHFDLVTLEHADFYPDGRDLGENYTHTSWLMSKCQESGKLDCNHCHTPSGRMRFEAGQENQSCLPCHKDKVDAPEAHSFHAPGSAGSSCVACHMPMTRFAAMGRSDHSMRPPMPESSLRFKSPNACNLCHKDRDAAWSNQWVKTWYPKDYQAADLARAELIDAARKGDWSHLDAMIQEMGRTKESSEVWRMSLARLLGTCPDEKVGPALAGRLTDPSPLVRASAASALKGHLDRPETLRALVAAARDGSRLVRVRVASSLASVPPQAIGDSEDRRFVDRAITEFRNAMKARPDDWSGYANLGNFALERRDYTEAAAQYELAHRLEPRVVGPMTNAAIAYSNLGQTAQAESSLKRALAAEPDNAAVNFNLGLLKAEQGDLPAAEAALRLALKSDPKMAAASHNLGILMAQSGKLDEAIAHCRSAYESEPSDPKHGQTLAFFLVQKGAAAEALGILRAVCVRHPGAVEPALLLADVLEKRGDRPAAAAEYRRLLALPGLPAAAVSQFRQEAERLGSSAR